MCELDDGVKRAIKSYNLEIRSMSYKNSFKRRIQKDANKQKQSKKVRTGKST